MNPPASRQDQPDSFAEPLPRLGDGVLLRRLAPSDLAIFQAYRNDADIARYQGWTAKSDDEAAAFLAEMSAAPLFQPGRWSQIAIAAPDDQGLIGDIGVHLAEDGREAEIGFTLRRESQGRGRGVAAVGAAIALVFAHTNADRIRGITDVRNLPSIRLLRRVGMRMTGTRTAVVRDETCIEHVYAISRSMA